MTRVTNKIVPHRKCSFAFRVLVSLKMLFKILMISIYVVCRRVASCSTLHVTRYSILEQDPFLVLKGWTPPCGKSPTLDTFINVVTNEILKPRPPPPTCHNLTAWEIAALKTISQNQNIIIKRADKGGAVVLMNRLDYIHEGLRQLNDTKFYKKIPKDTTNKIATDIQNFLQFLKARKLLPIEHISFLTPKNPRTPIFYLLPKIHKRNNPGRPIVSACDGPTEKLSAYLDFFPATTSPKS